MQEILPMIETERGLSDTDADDRRLDIDKRVS